MSSETALRRMRQTIFDYPDDRQEQADRVLHYLKARVLRARQERSEPVGPYSGLTRSELSRSGTCESDWF
jgi:hypothetical protein